MMSLDKIQTISDWPEPHKMKNIQSFMSFTNFYCWFIFNYSDIVVPLTQLTWRDDPWNFSEVCCQSFNALKKAFTTVPVLTHFIPDTPITVEMDILDYTVTSILSITCADGEVCLVASVSRSSPWTKKKPGPNWTWTLQDQDQKRPSDSLFWSQSQSFIDWKFSGPVKNWLRLVFIEDQHQGHDYIQTQVSQNV